MWIYYLVPFLSGVICYNHRLICARAHFKPENVLSKSLIFLFKILINISIRILFLRAHSHLIMESHLLHIIRHLSPMIVNDFDIILPYSYEKERRLTVE